MEKKQGKNLAVICDHVVEFLYIWDSGCSSVTQSREGYIEVGDRRERESVCVCVCTVYVIVVVVMVIVIVIVIASSF